MIRPPQYSYVPVGGFPRSSFDPPSPGRPVLAEQLAYAAEGVAERTAACFDETYSWAGGAPSRVLSSSYQNSVLNAAALFQSWGRWVVPGYSFSGRDASAPPSFDALETDFPYRYDPLPPDPVPSRSPVSAGPLRDLWSFVASFDRIVAREAVYSSSRSVTYSVTSSADLPSDDDDGDLSSGSYGALSYVTHFVDSTERFDPSAGSYRQCLVLDRSCASSPGRSSFEQALASPVPVDVPGDAVTSVVNVLVSWSSGSSNGSFRVWLVRDLASSSPLPSASELMSVATARGVSFPQSTSGAAAGDFASSAVSGVFFVLKPSWTFDPGRDFPGWTGA